MEKQMDLELKEKILKEFETVIDPELGVDIVNLGLVYGLSIDQDNVLKVDLTLTTPGCPLHDYFVENIEKASMNVDTIEDVEVNFVFDPPWDISKITDKARTQLGMTM